MIWGAISERIQIWRYKTGKDLDQSAIIIYADIWYAKLIFAWRDRLSSPIWFSCIEHLSIHSSIHPSIRTRSIPVYPTSLSHLPSIPPPIDPKSFLSLFWLWSTLLETHPPLKSLPSPSTRLPTNPAIHHCFSPWFHPKRTANQFGTGTHKCLEKAR